MVSGKFQKLGGDNLGNRSTEAHDEVFELFEI